MDLCGAVALGTKILDVYNVGVSILPWPQGLEDRFARFVAHGTFMQQVKRLVRRLIERTGYFFISREVMPYGIDFFHDINRLSQTPIRIFFDVGANIGQTSINALQKLKDAEVYAFEPNPKTYVQLATIRDARFHPHSLAMGATRGTGKLFCNGTTQDSLVFEGDGAEAITIKVETVDNFCQQTGITRINVLKTDTEGFDLNVLRGAEKSLQATDFVYSEFYDGPTHRGTPIDGLHAFLRPRGFQLIATYTDSINDQATTIANALFMRAGYRP